MCRLLIDGPADGAWNMAVDEALLDSVSRGGSPVMRFYGWSTPTVSLGYFQPHEDRHAHTASHGCRVVRRASGGGAIIHDRELTYSLVVPADDRLTADNGTLYNAVHGTLVALLRDFGVDATLCQRQDRDRRPPFLCFQRRAAGDLLVGHHKIAGSAQRRRRGAVLQHGSVLLRTSPSAPEIAGLFDLTSCKISRAELTNAWLAGLSVGLRLSWDEVSLTQEIEQEAQRLREDKYATSSWTHRK